MKPQEPIKTGQSDMFRSRLDQIIHMGHEKVVLADRIDWQFLFDTFGEAYTDRPAYRWSGWPGWRRREYTCPGRSRVQVIGHGYSVYGSILGSIGRRSLGRAMGVRISGAPP